ncbi:MAG: hypothetical protein ACFFD2_20855 [Promethearchaeota archaeon]
MTKERIVVGEKKKIHISSYQARIVAEVLLHDFRQLPDWKEAFSSGVFALYTPNYKDDNQYYEIKVSTPKRKDAGTIIVSTYKNMYPVQGFKTRGKTFTEKISAKSNYKSLKTVWLGGSCFIGEDEAGKEVAAIGEKQKIDLDRFSKEFEEFQKKKENEAREQPIDEIKEEWDELEPYLSRKKAPGNPTLGVEIHYVEGWSRHPNLDQYDLPNSDPVGCGPAAWGQYVSYHDMWWMPDLLYGTVCRKNAISCKSYAVNGVKLTDYMKKLMKKFHNALGTGWLGIPGFTPPWKMDDGTLIFANYLLLDNTYELVEDYSERVYYFGWDPANSVLNKIINQINNNNPVIVGLWYYSDDKSKKDKDKSGKTGHYCLGLGYSLNASGKLKFVFVDENHGNDDDSPGCCHDDVWWHRQNIFGVWAIKRQSYESPRTDTINNLLTSDIASLDSKIYMVSREKFQQAPAVDPKILIQRGSAVNYPIPQKDVSSKKLTFDEEVRKSIADIQGADTPCMGEISICTWNKRLQIAGPDLGKLMLKKKQDIADFISKLKVNISQIAGFSNIQHDEKSLNLNNLSSILSDTRKTINQSMNIDIHYFFTINKPYLFLSWRDIDRRIHIAFTIIQDELDDCVFNHVILPERFRTDVDPAIAIANGEINTPLLYVAFVADHPVMEDAPGSHFLGGIVSDAGQLLIITLENFFRFAQSGEDLWPTDYLPKVIYEKRRAGSSYRYHISEFIENWWLFDAPVSCVSLDSNGKKVALLWSSTREYNPFTESYPVNPILKLSIDYSFSSPTENLFARPLGVNLFNVLKIEFSRYYQSFYDTQAYLISEGYTGSEQVGSIYTEPNSRPDVFFLPDNPNKLILTWTNTENRLFVGMINPASHLSSGSNIGYLNKYHIVNLLSGFFKVAKNPKLHYVTDTLGNTDFILGYFTGNGFEQLETRFLFLKAGIDDVDDLPK